MSCKPVSNQLRAVQLFQMASNFLAFMFRALDLLLSLFGLVFGIPLMLILLLASYLDTGSPIFKQERVGRHRKPFVLVKFRTMKPGTSSAATHLVDVSAITPFGHFLRSSRLDELPQLWNVLKGDMSLVGPRPCLLNQGELITERVARRVFDVRPGLTGLAQIQGIDMSTPRLLAETDARMLANFTIVAYFKYILITVFGGMKDTRSKS